MKSTLPFFCSLLFISSAAAIDLTPRFRSITNADGGHIRLLFFEDGDQRVQLSLEPDVSVTGEGGSATFLFDKLQGATLTMRSSAHTPELLFTAEALVTYQTTALAFAPSGGSLIGELTPSPGPLDINGWKTYRFIGRFQLPGQTVTQSVTFVNLNAREQIVLITTALDGEFPDALGGSDAIINSWRTVTEEQLNTPSIN